MEVGTSDGGFTVWHFGAFGLEADTYLVVWGGNQGRAALRAVVVDMMFGRADVKAMRVEAQGPCIASSSVCLHGERRHRHRRNSANKGSESLVYPGLHFRPERIPPLLPSDAC